MNSVMPSLTPQYIMPIGHKSYLIAECTDNTYMFHKAEGYFSLVYHV